MNSQLALTLPASPVSNTVVINTRCMLRREEERCVVIVGGLPIHHYRADDRVAEAYAMVLLVDSGFAQQAEVARAFGQSERTVRRLQKRYAQSGMMGLGRMAGWRRGRRRISSERLRSIERLKGEGLSNRCIFRLMVIKDSTRRESLIPATALFCFPERDEDLAIEIAELLLSHGANPGFKNSKGLSAADEAERRGMDALAQLLRDAQQA